MPSTYRILAVVTLVVAAVIPSSCGGRPDPFADGTAEMAARLKDLADNMNPRFNFLIPGKRVDHLRNLPRPESRREQIDQDLLVATALLLDGANVEAIEALLAIQAEVEKDWTLVQPEALQFIDNMIAVAHLRHGELQNCLHGHQPESCLLPIRGSGVHTDQEGARAALAKYLEILEKYPDDLEALWLLNLSAMTLGEHPEAVPEQWLIPAETFDSDYPLPRFWDVAAHLGLDIVGLSGGIAIEDLDGDDDLDLFMTSWGPIDDPRVFRNNGDGSYTDMTEHSGLAGIAGGLNLVHGDYDNDGLPDIFILRGAWLGDAGHHPNSLLHNEGNFRFTDVTVAAGVDDANPTQTATWGDYNNDGWLDLYLGNESIDGQNNPCRLFRNNGDGSFTDAAAEAGVEVVGFVKAAVWGDYDNDGKQDLFLARLTQPNLLFHNDGPDADGVWRFSDVTESAGVGLPTNAFPSWWFDYDNDGWLDLLVFTYDAENRFAAKPREVVVDILGLPAKNERMRLYRNNGDGTFTDTAPELGLDAVLFTMGCNFGDLDNDGYLDVYAGTGAPDYRSLMPNRMFRNDRGLAFQDVTTAGGFGHLQKGHAVAFADMDNDGDQDVYAVMGGAYAGDVYQNTLFANPGNDNSWVTVSLVGGPSNRSAIGARIAVFTEGPSGPAEFHRVVTTGGSFGSSSLQQEIGLGDAERIVALEVRWPSGSSRRFDDIPIRRIVRIREDEDGFETVTLPVQDLASLAAEPMPAHGGHQHGS
jgi:hypothetical protein